MLEIGCGTGSDLVALAEQGVILTAMDICEKSIEMARLRCQLYELPVTIHTANATEIGDLFGAGQFDWVVFYASLEHMTQDERIRAIVEAWRLLDRGGHLVVVETPNRLWHSDGHSAWMPFFHWLPDDLAFRYSRFSSRENLRDCFRELNSGSSCSHF